MCLGIPMKIKKVTGKSIAIAELEDSTREVDISLVPGLLEGDYVIVHAGYAIEKLDRAEADERIELFEELAELWQEQKVSA